MMDCAEITQNLPDQQLNGGDTPSSAGGSVIVIDGPYTPEPCSPTLNELDPNYIPTEQQRQSEWEVPWSPTAGNNVTSPRPIVASPSSPNYYPHQTGHSPVYDPGDFSTRTPAAPVGFP